MAASLGSAALGCLALMAIWLVFGRWLGLDWPLRVTDGADGRPSTSKFQFLLWTAVVIWGYVAVATVRWLNGGEPGEIGIPANLVLLMGLGAGTAIGAKLVTTARGGRPALLDRTERTYRSLVADDDGNPALEKIQVLAWTFVAMAVFVLSVWQDIAGNTPPTALPNVGDPVVLLLGVGQIAYVGVKAVPLPRPQASGSPTAAAAESTPATQPPVPASDRGGASAHRDSL